MVRAPDPHVLDAILEHLAYLGAATGVGDAPFVPAERDGILPDEFYSTTNFDTWVRIERQVDSSPSTRRWTAPSSLRDGVPRCVKMRPGRSRAKPWPCAATASASSRLERSRDYSVFGFMSNDISAEINKTHRHRRHGPRDEARA